MLKIGSPKSRGKTTQQVLVATITVVFKAVSIIWTPRGTGDLIYVTPGPCHAQLNCSNASQDSAASQLNRPTAVPQIGEDPATRCIAGCTSQCYEHQKRVSRCTPRCLPDAYPQGTCVCATPDTHAHKLVMDGSSKQTQVMRMWHTNAVRT